MGKRNRQNSAFDYTSASLAAIALASAMVLTACGPGNGAAPDASNTVAAAPVPQRAAPAPRPVVVNNAHVGEVSSIETLTERPKGTGAGAVIGGVLGGVAGHQVGDGNGQKVATAAGAVGGALLGNKIERDRKERVTGYRVQVRLDNGDVRTFEESQLSGLRVGDRVRVDGGNLRRA
jgi:uncharacterized protein YcfJ